MSDALIDTMLKAAERIPKVTKFVWKMHPDLAALIQEAGYWDFSKGPMTVEAFDAMVRDMEARTQHEIP